MFLFSSLCTELAGTNNISADYNYAYGPATVFGHILSYVTDPFVAINLNTNINLNSFNAKGVTCYKKMFLLPVVSLWVLHFSCQCVPAPEIRDFR